VAKKRILVVDDEVYILKFMNNFLTANGFEVFIASNGLEGIDLAKNHRVDLIITDIKMPIMNGYRLIQELKSDPTYRDLPIIVITGYAVEEDDRKKAAQYGVIDYITKPLQIEEVLNNVNKYLGGSQT
jgi:CheY-like chemotaxis protein